MPKPIIETLPEDEIRVKILAIFLQCLQKPRGMSSCKIPISKVTSDLKKVSLGKDLGY